MQYPTDPCASPRPASRRGFLKRLAAAGALGAMGTRALAALPGPVSAPAPVRELGFLNLHTGEKLRVPYWENGRYLQDALAEINHVLRDHRANAVHAIDTGLLDLLARLQAAVGNSRAFEVISGYRAPSSNEMLRARSSGVAQGSLHLQGKAIDIRLSGVPLADLRDAARSLRAGGVGYYPREQFVHVDTGRVRAW